jgi:ribose transport system substrate-binding protein
VKVVARQPGDFNPDTGLKVMENILNAQKKIDAVYTHDDDMAQGVVQAIRNAGRDNGWHQAVGPVGRCSRPAGSTHAGEELGARRRSR